MRLLSLAARNLKQRALSTALTILSILLGTGIVAFLWLAATQAHKRYVTSSKGYDVVIGDKLSSTLDLVLVSVFLVKNAQGFIPLSVYKELHDDRRKWGRNVRTVVPFAYGDTYRGFPILATTDEWFKRWGSPSEAMAETTRPPELGFAAGGPFDFSHEDLLKEAAFQDHLKSTDDHSGHDHAHADRIPPDWKRVVIGAAVARGLGLWLGSKLVPTHGAENELHEHAEAECEVVGVLEPMGTPIDRAIYMPLGCFFRMQEHDAVRASGAENQWGDVPVSALVVNTRPGGDLRVNAAFRRRLDAQAALPKIEIRRLFRIVGNVSVALHAISWVVLVVACIGIFVSLYNTMNERRRDVAIMRSLGARRVQIFGIVLLEAVLITAVGATLGVGGAHSTAELFSGWLFDRTGVPMHGAAFEIRELWLILGVVVLGGVAGILPAAQASRTDVARFLTPDR